MGICPIQWRKVFPWYWLHWQETIQIDSGMVSKLLLLHLSKYNCFNIHADVGTVQNNTGIVQNWQVRLVHRQIATSVQISCSYIILLNQLFRLTDFFTKQGNSCLLMLVQYKLILVLYKIDRKW